MDPSQTLKENLEGKAIIEFPVIYVILKDHKDGYDIITPGILKSIVHHVYFLKLDVQQQQALIIVPCSRSRRRNTKQKQTR